MAAQPVRKASGRRSSSRVKLPRVSERQQQAAIVKLLRSLGAQVYVLGTTRRRGDHPGTMQTPGIPDLMAFLPPSPLLTGGSWVFLFVEVKAAGGRLRLEQAEFQGYCADANIWHLVGDLDRVLKWATQVGYLP